MNTKCEVCNKTDELVLQPSGYYLCQVHDKKIKDRKITSTENPVILNSSELKGLKAEGLISLRFYVYMALRIEGITSSLKPVEISQFCNKWAIRSEDFLAAVASLSRKGIVKMNVPNFMAQAVTHDERIKELERSYDS